MTNPSWEQDWLQLCTVTDFYSDFSEVLSQQDLSLRGGDIREEDKDIDEDQWDQDQGHCDDIVVVEKEEEEEKSVYNLGGTLSLENHSLRETLKSKKRKRAEDDDGKEEDDNDDDDDYPERLALSSDDEGLDKNVNAKIEDGDDAAQSPPSPLASNRDNGSGLSDSSDGHNDGGSNGDGSGGCNRSSGSNNGGYSRRYSSSSHHTPNYSSGSPTSTSSSGSGSSSSDGSQESGSSSNNPDNPPPPFAPPAPSQLPLLHSVDLFVGPGGKGN